MSGEQTYITKKKKKSINIINGITYQKNTLLSAPCEKDIEFVHRVAYLFIEMNWAMALDITNISPEACRKYLLFDKKEVDEPQQQLIWMLNLVQTTNVLKAKIAKASILTISHHQISTSLVHTTYGFCFQWSSSLVCQTKKHPNGEKKTIKILKWIVVNTHESEKTSPDFMQPI